MRYSKKSSVDILFYLVKEESGWNIFNASTNGLILTSLSSKKTLAFLETNNPDHPAIQLIEEEIGTKEEVFESNTSDKIGLRQMKTPMNFNHYLMGKFNG